MKKWLVMTTLILGSGMAAGAPVEITPYLGESWYGLYFNGEKVGFLLKSVSVTDAGEIHVEEDAQFMVTMSGAKQDMSIYSKRAYASSGELLHITAEMKDPAQLSTFNAQVQGNNLVMTSVLGGAVREEEFPKPTESVTDALRHAIWAREEPEVDDVIHFSVFEPMYQKEVSGISRITGTEKRVFNGVLTTVYDIHSVLDLMDIESTSYVTDCGVTVEDVVAGVFTMRLEPKEAAQDVDYTVDTMVSNAVTLDEPIENPRGRDWLRLALRGPLRETHLINDNRQTMREAEDYVDFYAERTDIDALSLPELPIEDEELQPYLEASTYAQSDAPEIIEKAAEIIGDETCPLAMAKKLCNWVSGNMRNVFSARLSNALEVLDSMEGDCTEHTVLYVALARAAGLPAKKVAGLIYVESGQPGFYFHQWASVWLGEWVDVDPAFNQLPVDVTHIKFAEGDMFRQARILPLIGRLDIDVINEPLPPETEETDAEDEDAPAEASE